MTELTLGGWLVHVMREADGALSLEEALHVIMDSMKQYFPSQSVAIVLIDEDTKALRIKISRQISYSFVKQYHRDGPSPTAERVVLEQQPVLLNNLDPESDTYGQLKLEHEYTSAVLAPVVRNQRGIGYVFCDRNDAEPFNDSDLLHLQVIGYLVGQLIEKFELIQAGKKLSQIDDASKALQYKAFIPALATELERSREHEYAVTLALLSVGAFRKYIDTYGINEAHALLAEIVSVINLDIRDMDILARFGADEFILCLSGCDEAGARNKLGVLQRKIAETVVGQGDAAIDIIVGAVVLPNADATRRPLQEILATLGKKLMEAKTRQTEDLIIAPLTIP